MTGGVRCWEGVLRDSVTEASVVATVATVAAVAAVATVATVAAVATAAIHIATRP